MMISLTHLSDKSKRGPFVCFDKLGYVEGGHQQNCADGFLVVFDREKISGIYSVEVPCQFVVHRGSHRVEAGMALSNAPKRYAVGARLITANL